MIEQTLNQMTPQQIQTYFSFLIALIFILRIDSSMRGTTKALIELKDTLKVFLNNKKIA